MNSYNPAITICIPAYKNTQFLKRLLDSVAVQTFTDYEVIITDDSPDDSVKDFIENYKSIERLIYCRNRPALGTPENWNEGIRRANGAWIKLMHDDDWFTQEKALETFYTATINHPHISFFFSAFQNTTEETGSVQVVRCNYFDLLFLRLSPLHLFKRVYVGNPSCTFIKREVGLLYDKDFKFVVDFEYYIRCLHKLKHFHYIDEVLLNIGFNNEQVTKYTYGVPEVQLPENILMLQKMGEGILKNPVVYDYYWRMFRNLNIKNSEQVRLHYKGFIPSKLLLLLHHQSRVPRAYLKIGISSKFFMTISYALSLFKR